MTQYKKKIFIRNVQNWNARQKRIKKWHFYHFTLGRSSAGVIVTNTTLRHKCFHVNSSKSKFDH